MSDMMIMDLNSAEKLLASCWDTEMQEYLATKIREAEYADICNDVFLSFYINTYMLVAQENRIEFILR